MILRTCLSCTHHKVREELETRVSYCLKENCLSQYSKCIAERAIEQFLKRDRLEAYHSFSALAHLYSDI
jgi:hypothetical protein